ncbi:hypothetical protein GH714_000252 [Hevea brasiliensis]|uniref:Uncharacterized protein n=1 Tax=Hevea brasiliensis TaxID=3981 RepID=A0A6A6M9Z4_HEVBR|nr:hypothetical protein GH714_000252 [Hevea brasiliensis]
MLFERSQVECKLGMDGWKKNLDTAVERFRLAGASEADISMVLKNHCSNGGAVEGDEKKDQNANADAGSEKSKQADKVRGKGIIDAQIGGEFIMKQEDEAYELLEKIAKNTHIWRSLRGPAPTQKRQAAGMYDLDPFNMINAKFDAFTNVLEKKMEDLSMLVSSSSSSGSSQ